MGRSLAIIVALSLASCAPRPAPPAVTIDLHTLPKDIVVEINRARGLSDDGTPRTEPR